MKQVICKLNHRYILPETNEIVRFNVFYVFKFVIRGSGVGQISSHRNNSNETKPKTCKRELIIMSPRNTGVQYV